MFKSEDRQENVSQVKIVACDSKLLTQWEMLITSNREYMLTPFVIDFEFFFNHFVNSALAIYVELRLQPTV